MPNPLQVKSNSEESLIEEGRSLGGVEVLDAPDPLKNDWESEAKFLGAMDMNEGPESLSTTFLASKNMVVAHPASMAPADIHNEINNTVLAVPYQDPFMMLAKQDIAIQQPKTPKELQVRNSPDPRIAEAEALTPKEDANLGLGKLLSYYPQRLIAGWEKSAFGALQLAFQTAGAYRKYAPAMGADYMLDKSFVEQTNGFIKGAIDYFGNPGENGYYSHIVDEKRAAYDKALYSKNTLWAVAGNFTDATLDFTSFISQLGASQMISGASKAAAGVSMAEKAAEKLLPKALRLAKESLPIATFGFVTSTGGVTERGQSAIALVAYNNTGKIANAIGVKGLKNVTVAAAFNALVSSPEYYHIIKKNGLTMDAVALMIPKLVFDLGFAFMNPRKSGSKAEKSMERYLEFRFSEKTIDGVNYAGFKEDMRPYYVSLKEIVRGNKSAVEFSEEQVQKFQADLVPPKEAKIEIVGEKKSDEKVSKPSEEPEMVDIYHGTLSSRVEGIYKEGIQPGKFLNYDMRTSPRAVADMDKVFITTDPKYAKHFALRAEYKNFEKQGDGVIIHARVPKKEFESMAKDPEDSPGNYMTTNIKPEWIVGTRTLDKYLEATESKPSKAEPPPVVPSVPVVEQAPLPNRKVSGVAKSINEKMIERGLTEGLEGLAEYNTVNRKAQAKGVYEMLQTDPDRVKRIAMGQEPGTAEVKPVTAFRALELLADVEGDVQMNADLVKSPLNTMFSEAGQTLGGLAGRNPNSTVTAAREVKTARENKIRKLSGEENLSDAQKKVEAAIKKAAAREVKRKENLEAFLKTITC